MLNCIDGTRKDLKETFSVAHFDLIIIDEAHRSVYQKFGAIFDYFDSLLLGLTATPRGEVDRNTYRLFGLDNYQPTYAYELDQAVEDGFLVPPKALSVPLMFQREGVRYHDLSPEEQEEYEQQESFYDPETGVMHEEIGSAALNRWLFNTDTVDQVLMHLMEAGIKVEGGDKLGKTIVFAKNTKHADFIVDRFDKNYPHLAGKFCRKIDYSVKYAQSLIDEFSLTDTYPQIAVSVDMLDTGIDIPEVVNLVFFKLVRSRVKFWQMIGRGTRLREDLFGPGEHKECFLVFDYCQNLDFFAENPDGYEGKAQPSLKQRIFNQRLLLKEAIETGGPADEELLTLANELTDQLHSAVSRMNVDNFIVRKERQNVENFRDRKKWNDLNDADLEVLREKLSGLPTPDEDDETARRFDLLILNLQCAILSKAKAQVGYRDAVIDIASGLEEKKAIPAVAGQLELILELQTDDFWEAVTLPILEDVRKRLRKLTRFVDPKAGRADAFTHFEDLLLAEDAEEYNLVKANPKLRDYRNRVQRFIRENQDHITIRRLKNNEPVTPKDLEALEQILFSEDGPIPREEFEKLYGGDKPLGVLVRKITGLDQRAAKEAFAKFLAQGPLTPDQMSFIDEVINYVIKNGTIDPEVLFETPFSNYNTKGVVGVFPKRAKDIVEIISRINANAGAA
jgi:type I restriction enzyme R subunit